MKVWLIGAYGAVSTTAMVGGVSLEKGLIGKTGLVTELPYFEGLESIAPLNFEFGGHEIRPLKNAYEAAVEHIELNKHYERSILEDVKDRMEKIIPSTGTAINCGSGMEELGNLKTLEQDGMSLSDITEQLIKDMKRFADENTVVINVASTEPFPESSKEYHGSLSGFETMLDEDKKKYVTASMLYAYAALKIGLPYANFTPSFGSNIPALKELAEKNAPHAGIDGKTGETLVKTTLAPMFLYRNLKVIGWMSYNILGDYDGKVLAHSDNKKTKVESKDKVLEKTLGYTPYSITEIEFFPSLLDNKTAFDFIHFEGFLGAQMKYYFIWDAIDAIVAAPLILDLSRFLVFAKKKGVRGIVKELGFFFKSPMESNLVNTHTQFEELRNWYERLSSR